MDNKTLNGITITLNSDGSFTANGTATANAFFNEIILSDNLKNNQKYTISCSITGDSSATYQFFMPSSAVSSAKYNISKGTTFTAAASGKVKFSFVVYKGITVNNLVFKPQLEEGSTATDYEPYGYKIPITVSNGSDTKTTNIYLKEPLRKVGEYADYLDLTNKKVVRNVKELILNGTENWTKYTSVNNHYQLIVGDNYFSRDTNSILSNYYIKATSGSYNSSLNYAVISADANRIRFKDKDISTIEDWKNKLVGYADSNKPLKVIYQLANETEENIEVPSIPNLTGNITYSIDTTIKPSSINYSTK